MSKILYISYDGMLEPLGQSQVIGYLEKLSKDHQIYLISFEKGIDRKDKNRMLKMNERMEKANIYWKPFLYHKSPTVLATTFDIMIGTFVATCYVKVKRINIIHARSYVPALMALLVKRLTGVRFLFDMRGFWVDERVDGELWPENGSIHKISKWFEKHLFLSADHVVLLTQAAIKELHRFDYLKGKKLSISVIPTCANFNLFKPLLKVKNEKVFILGYVGSVGLYYLFDYVLLAFVELLKIKPNSRLMIINRGQHELIRNRFSKLKINYSRVDLISADHEEMPDLMSYMDAAIFFIKPTFSKKASAPTKLAEFLGCGIPCLSNSGVGDVAEVLNEENIGVVITSFEKDVIIEGVKKLIDLASNPLTSKLCISVAHKYFSLDNGVKKYNIAYESVILNQ